MIWWFLVSINFCLLLFKNFYTPKNVNFHDVYNTQSDINKEKLILGEDYNLTSLKLKVDFGSFDTGTKIIEYSKGIKNIKSVQEQDYDSYMLTPCHSDIWWIYSFSDIIHIEKIGVVSLEHYASNFKDIEILGSDVYPAKTWKQLGKIRTDFTKSFELFNIYEHCKNYEEDSCWVRYLKIQVLSHHSFENNYYCTLTLLQIFASSGVDMLSNKIYSDEDEEEEEDKKRQIEEIKKEQLLEEKKEKEYNEKEETEGENDEEEDLDDDDDEDDDSTGDTINGEEETATIHYTKELDKEKRKEMIIEKKEENKEERFREIVNVINVCEVFKAFQYTLLCNKTNYVYKEKKLLLKNYNDKNQMKVTENTYKLSMNHIAKVKNNMDILMRNLKKDNKKNSLVNLKMISPFHLFLENTRNEIYKQINYPNHWLQVLKTIAKEELLNRQKKLKQQQQSLRKHKDKEKYNNRGNNVITKENIKTNEKRSIGKKISYTEKEHKNKNLMKRRDICVYYHLNNVKNIWKNHNTLVCNLDVQKCLPFPFTKRMKPTPKSKSIVYGKIITALNRKPLKPISNQKRESLTNIQMKTKEHKYKNKSIYNSTDKNVSTKMVKKDKHKKNFQSNEFKENLRILDFVIYNLKKHNSFNVKWTDYCRNQMFQKNKKNPLSTIISIVRTENLLKHWCKKQKCFPMALNYVNLSKGRVFRIRSKHTLKRVYSVLKQPNESYELNMVQKKEEPIINVCFDNSSNKNKMKNILKNIKKCNTFIILLYKIKVKNILFHYYINEFITKGKGTNILKTRYCSLWRNFLDTHEKYLPDFLKDDAINISMYVQKYLNKKCKIIYPVSYEKEKKNKRNFYKNKSISSIIHKIFTNTNLFKKYLKNIRKQKMSLCPLYKHVIYTLFIYHIKKFIEKNKIKQSSQEPTKKSLQTKGSSTDTRNGKNEQKKRTREKKKNNNNTRESQSNRGSDFYVEKKAPEYCVDKSPTSSNKNGEKGKNAYPEEQTKKSNDKDKYKKVIDAFLNDVTENNYKIMNEMKKNEGIDSELVHQVNSIIRHFENNETNANLPIEDKKKHEKNESYLMINKEEKQEQEEMKKNKEDKLNFLEDLDKYFEENLNFPNENCIQEKVEEKSKNVRGGHALLTLVDKIKTIEQKNNYIFSKLREVAKITNNKSKVLFHVLSNIKELQDTTSILLKYIVLNDKNMKTLNAARKNSDLLLKKLKEICVFKINQKTKNFDSLELLCKHFEDVLFDEFEKKFLMEKMQREFSFYNNSQNILPQNNKIRFPHNNLHLMLKEQKKTIFDFLYYQNHCRNNDIFKTPISHYTASVNNIQSFYYQYIHIIKNTHILKHIVSKIEKYIKIVQSFLKNEYNFFVFFLYIFLILFILNMIVCFLIYKHLSHKLNMYIQNCSCHKNEPHNESYELTN